MTLHSSFTKAKRTEFFFKTLLSEYSQHDLKKAEFILHNYLLFCFHFYEKREISIFCFLPEIWIFFKRIKHLSTMHAFSSYSSFLSNFFGKKNGSYSSCNVRDKKLIHQMRNSTLELDLNYEL